MPETGQHQRHTRAPVRIDILRRMIRTGAHNRAQKLIERMPPADIAELLPNLSGGEQKTLVNLLFNSARAGKVLAELPVEFLPEVLPMVEDRQMATIVGRVPPDDGAYFVEMLPEERRLPVLRLLEPTVRIHIERILGSPEESAGALMTTRIATLHESATCEEGVAHLRKIGETVEEIFYLYAVDEENHLKGVVPIRKLLLAPGEKLIRDVMITDPVSIREDADQEVAADLVEKYNLMALPVVDETGKLLGTITVDDVLEVIQEEATEDMYRMVGLDEEDRVFSPMMLSLQRRLPWMVLNLATAFLAASVVGAFENTIRSVVVLAAFLPVVAGMGGNVGTQTLTVVTRGIALGELSLSSVMAVMGKQIGIGLCIGASVGLLAAGAGYLWQGNAYLGAVLFLAMCVNLALAGLAGASVPLLLHRFRLDPAMGSGVIVTTVTDVGGFFAFLGLATLFLDKLQMAH
ncbi:MAG: magnesium transporter [Chrysiogenetes bacterium]|nr:magnesium transporter [Chrysiogenetes bacterium]